MGHQSVGQRSAVDCQRSKAVILQNEPKSIGWGSDPSKPPQNPFFKKLHFVVEFTLKIQSFI